MQGEPKGARAPESSPTPPDGPVDFALMGPMTRRALRVRAAIAEGRYRRDPKAIAEAFVIREYFELEP
ncbi:MAG: hypothetical protein H6746_17280 [Deltaproteobacteria bacterium]|nr:hypothetical protein [Deltaproteobacteria bacterium]